MLCYSCGRGERPENTLEGIRHCQAVNPNWRIEMDVQMTADGELVLFHDYNTLRTTGVDARINELRYAELTDLNAGFHFKKNDAYPYRDSPISIPRLEEVFLEFPQAKLILDIHTNDPKVMDRFITLLESTFPQGDFIVVSEYDAIIKGIRQKRPHWRYGVPANEAKRMLYSSFVFLDGLFPIKSDILMLPKKYGAIEVLSKRVLRHAKKRNKPIWAWLYEGDYVKTVTSKAELEELEQLGIAGVYTGYPEKLSRELA